MFFHVKTAILIILLTSGVGLAVNAIRTTTKIEPAKFGKRSISPDATPPAAAGPKDAPAGAAAASPAADPHVAVLDDVIKSIGEPNVYFVDARKPEEFAQGHIKGAINLPSTALFENIERVVQYVPQPDLVIVYCGGGNCESSHTVADALRNQFGYINVKVYVKGWEELLTSPKFAELTEVSP